MLFLHFSKTKTEKMKSKGWQVTGVRLGHDLIVPLEAAEPFMTPRSSVVAFGVKKNVPLKRR